MDVEDSVGKTGDSFGTEDPHEPGQDQSLDAGFLGGVADLPGELGPIAPRRDQRRRDRCLAGALQGSAFGGVADHQLETRQPVIDQGLEVGARAAGENCEFDQGFLEMAGPGKFWLTGRGR